MVILDYNEVRSLERIQQALMPVNGWQGSSAPSSRDCRITVYLAGGTVFRARAGAGAQPLTPDLSSSERRLEMERSAMPLSAR